MAIVVALFGLPQPLVLAESTTEINKISTENSPELANIGANDFFPGGKQSSTVTNSQGFYTPLSFNGDTTRTMTWEMRVRRSDLPDNLPEDLEIEYELTDNNNTNNQLNKNVSGTDPTLPVTVIRIKDQEVVEEECSSETEGECETVLVKGAARLTINISRFRQAGDYEGRLLVCLKNKNGECI
ncbi:MAG: hypothetical protein MJK14_02705 [Rivularia sp. ALOHA_DT_140]|nr:hypothetical protein [Rivularia sp. ALOHA_DT_140]